MNYLTANLVFRLALLLFCFQWSSIVVARPLWVPETQRLLYMKESRIGGTPFSPKAIFVLVTESVSKHQPAVYPVRIIDGIQWNSNRFSFDVILLDLMSPVRLLPSGEYRWAAGRRSKFIDWPGWESLSVSQSEGSRVDVGGRAPRISDPDGNSPRTQTQLIRRTIHAHGHHAYRGTLNDLVHGKRISVSTPLKAADDDKAERKERNGSSEPNEPPIGRRLTLAVCLFLGGFFWSFRYREDFDYSRRLLSAENLFGLFVTGLGLFVWWGTFAFPCTWGWWL